MSAQDLTGNMRLTKAASVGLNYTTLIRAGGGGMMKGIHSVSHEITDGHERFFSPATRSLHLPAFFFFFFY